MVLLAAIAAGGIAVWSFVSRQSVAIQPEPLPKIIVAAESLSSPVAAAWVKLLGRAGMQATLVSLDKLEPGGGLVLLCDVPNVPGALVSVGRSPDLHLRAEAGTSDAAMRYSESVSPLLARIDPGHEVASRRVPVALLEESPRMIVDARWKDSARAAIMHMEADRNRWLWFGFQPDALADDAQLLASLRSAFRWVAGQPVSDGAIGDLQIAQTLTPQARLQARRNRFAFSVDRQQRDMSILTIRMMNRGDAVLPNPTVKIWLPREAKSVALAGDPITRRGAMLIATPEDRACVVTLLKLDPREERVLKLRVD